MFVYATNHWSLKTKAKPNIGETEAKMLMGHSNSIKYGHGTHEVSHGTNLVI